MTNLIRQFSVRRKSLITRLAEANNPEKIFFISFLAVIFAGSVLLWLPVSNLKEHAPYIDNLFVSFSAVCVTGLSTVTASSQYSIFGKSVLICLMEIGGLGPMTIIAIMFLRNRRRMETTEKKLFAAGSGKSDLYDVPAYLRRIILFTVTFELIGWALLSIRLTGICGKAEGIFHALFLSVSAFTNAGFDTLGADSLAGYAADPLINYTVMALIITGGLGFMVWFEMSARLRGKIKLQDVFHQKRKKMSLHSSVVLRTTVALLAAGTVLFFLFESENPGTLAGRGTAEKVLVSMFQSVTLRTAGFATVSIGNCTRPMILIMCVFMLIGGSPGGTAGGLKTTTAYVLYRTALNSLNDRYKDAVIRHRRVSPSLLKHAFVILVLYVMTLFTAVLFLTITEPQTDLLPLIFEAASAIATVGLSVGITAELSALGKIIIMILMFVGRLGPLSVYLAFHRTQEKTKHVQYPDANIIIG